MQQLTTLPRRSPLTSCSGNNSNLTSSTGKHPVTMICKSSYSFHFIASLVFLLHCLSSISFTISACKISSRLWSHPFQSSTSTMDRLTTRTHKTQLATNHRFGFPNVNFHAIAIMCLLPFSRLIPESFNCLTHQD